MQGEHFHRCVHRIAWTRARRQGSCKLSFSLLRLGRNIVRKYNRANQAHRPEIPVVLRGNAT